MPQPPPLSPLPSTLGMCSTLTQVRRRDRRGRPAAAKTELRWGADAGTVRAQAVPWCSRRGELARRQGVVEGFLQEFGLSTPEGLALMCLAEALLRTPDEATRDALIAEKIGSADWSAHVGRSDSVFVNAGTWGLMLTGRLVEPDEGAKKDLAGFLKGLAGRLGEPVIRRAVATAIGVMGDQFVLGRTDSGGAEAGRARSGFVLLVRHARRGRAHLRRRRAL